MNAHPYPDFGNTIPAVYEAQCLSLATRRVTPMARLSNGKPRLNRPFAALVAVVFAEVAAIAWWLS